MKLLCNITRGKNIESRHEVYSVAIDEDEKTIFFTGNPDFVTCVRSSLKPFQASASILSGATEAAGFNRKEIALMCASHNGEEIHVNLAKGMANKLNVQNSAPVKTACCSCHTHPWMRMGGKANGIESTTHFFQLT